MSLVAALSPPSNQHSRDFQRRKTRQEYQRAPSTVLISLEGKEPVNLDIRKCHYVFDILDAFREMHCEQLKFVDTPWLRLHTNPWKPRLDVSDLKASIFRRPDFPSDGILHILVSIERGNVWKLLDLGSVP